MQYEILPGKHHKDLKAKELGDHHDGASEVLFDISNFKFTDMLICKQLRDTLNSMNVFDLDHKFFITDEHGNIIKIGKDKHHEGKSKHHRGNNKHHDKNAKTYGMKQHGDGHKSTIPHSGKHHDDYGSDDEDKPSRIYGMKHHDGGHRPPRSHGAKHDADDNDIPPGPPNEHKYHDEKDKMIHEDKLRKNKKNSKIHRSKIVKYPLSKEEI